MSLINRDDAIASIKIAVLVCHILESIVPDDMKTRLKDDCDMLEAVIRELNNLPAAECKCDTCRFTYYEKEDDE